MSSNSGGSDQSVEKAEGAKSKDTTSMKTGTDAVIGGKDAKVNQNLYKDGMQFNNNDSPSDHALKAITGNSEEEAIQQDGRGS